jgi:hypothetical protein
MRYDILLDANNDLRIDNNDLIYGESTEQHQQLLLISAKGDFKETPTASVGASGYLNDENVNGLLAEIKSEFERDGMQLKEIKITNNQLYINASYSD